MTATVTATMATAVTATMEPDAPLDGVMLWIEPDRN